LAVGSWQLKAEESGDKAGESGKPDRSYRAYRTYWEGQFGVQARRDLPPKEKEPEETTRF
jgi:hypothetical protein